MADRRRQEPEREPQKEVPPQSLEMEQASLGAMIVDPKAIGTAAEILQPSHFYADAHKLIYEAILLLHQQTMPVDLLSIQNQLRAMPAWGDVLQNVGGPAYLIQLTDAVPGAANITHYATVVEEKAILRRMIDAGLIIQAIAKNDVDSLPEKLSRAEKELALITEGRGGAGLMAGEIGAEELPPTRPVDDLWFAIYPGRAHLLIGETGSGKSSILYNLTIHAGRNEPLWRICFGIGRPLRCYYLDPENAGNYRDTDPTLRDGGLCRRKIDNILGNEERLPPTIRFADADGLNLSEPSHLQRLERRIKRGIGGQPFDLVLLDPISTLFRVEDENSNSEMGHVGDAVRLLSRRTGAAVLASHHTGKGSVTTSGVLSGRGASALASAMDVVLTFRARGPREDEEDEDYTGEARIRRDVCRLKIEKDRPAQYGRGASIYLRMGSPRLDCFERVEFQVWRDAGQGERESHGPKAEQAKPIIRRLLSDGEWQKRTDLIGKSGNREIGRNSVDAALEQMAAEGEIESKRFGNSAVYYRKAVYKPDGSISRTDGEIGKLTEPDGDTKSTPEFNFPISRFPDAVSETGNTGKSDPVAQFFGEEDPFADDPDPQEPAP